MASVVVAGVDMMLTDFDPVTLLSDLYEMSLQHSEDC